MAMQSMTIRKTSRVWGFALLGIATGTHLFTSSARAETIGFSLNQNAAPGRAADDLSVRVLDDSTQMPIPGASVSIADTLEDEAAAQKNSTDVNGHIAFQATPVTSHPRCITVRKDGYTTLSLLGVQSPTVTIYLKGILAPGTPQAQPVMASGTMASWPRMDSKNVTAGVVFKSMSPFDLLHFDSGSFISPLKDTIDVLGPRQIPSNISVPDQTITVVFAPVRLRKPEFRLPLARAASVTLAAIQGSIPVSDVLSAVQGGKASLELLNKLKVSRAAIAPNLPADADIKRTLDANIPLSPQHKVTVSQPPFAGDILVTALTDLNGDRMTLLPTDIKQAYDAGKPGAIRPVQLNGPSGSQSRAVVAVAMSEKARQISGVVAVPAGADVNTGAFLPAVALNDSETLPAQIALPSVTHGVSAAIFESEHSTQWIVYALPGASRASVPASHLDSKERLTQYSVLSLELAQTFDGRELDGTTALKGLRRFSRSKANVGASQP